MDRGRKSDCSGLSALEYVGEWLWGNYCTFGGIGVCNHQLDEHCRRLVKYRYIYIYMYMP